MRVPHPLGHRRLRPRRRGAFAAQSGKHPAVFQYVDWVGTTWYSPHLAVKAMQRFYRYRLRRKKPFAFGEYGVWGRESPRFLGLFFRFVRTHRRVQLVSYYQSAMLKPEFRLSTHPVSRSVLRRKLSSSKFLSGG